MERRLNHLYITLCTLGILLSGCLSDSATSRSPGTGEETTNGLSGIISDSKGPVADVDVSLFSENYHPLNEDNAWQVRMETTTDKNGQYQFENLLNGHYNVAAANSTDDLNVLLKRLHIESDTSHISAPEAILRPAGKVSISLNELNVSDSGYVYIPGTDFYAKITTENIANGTKTFKGLPSGEYDKIMFTENPEEESYNILGSSIDIVSNTTATPGPFAAWSQSAEIVVNTSVDGANLKDDLFGFPLLLRLSADNFSFENTAPAGIDIRFAKQDDTPLPFEIEHWDHDGKSAAVWIGLDTVKSQNADQSIRMYWGNMNVQNKSNGPAVFDVNNGFSGVWHLSDNNQNFTITESSGQHFGIARERKTEIQSADISTRGIIGGGINLLEKRWVDLGHERDYLNGQAAATLSGWFNPDLNDEVMALINIGVGQEDSSISTRAGVEIAADSTVRVMGRALDTRTGNEKTFSADTVKSNTWYYFTAIIDYAADSLFIYLDGDLNKIDRAMFTLGMTEATNSINSAIGSQELGGHYFYGQLDEMRVVKGVRSADWIKMCYETQRPGSDVVYIT